MSETGNGNGNGSIAAHVNMRMFIQVLTFAISAVVTGIGGTLFILNRIDSVNMNLVTMDNKLNTMFTMHKIEDWTLANQRIYNKMFGLKNTNIIVPSIDDILNSLQGP